ncbi:MAG: hypothetical protein QM709_04450 [Spongiibacteraceae bacterium]
MRQKIGLLIVGLSLSMGASAMSDMEKQYVERMVSGGPMSVREAADYMYNAGTTDQEALDVAAEVLAQGYRRAEASDAMAWVCKVLGNSGNGRYKPLLEQVAKEGDRRLQRHCSKAADNLSAGAAAYQVGSVDLAKYRAGAAPSAGNATAAKSVQPAAAGGSGSIADVKVGMSMEQVVSILGQPTAMTSYVTGKAFNPFNVTGKDSHRQVGLYKGIGRVEYGNSSAYTSTMRVVNIVANPNESGYP